MGLFSFLKKKFSHKSNNDNSLLNYDKGLNKAKKSFTDKINKLADNDDKIESDYFEKLEEILLEADIGASLTMEIIENLINTVKKEKITSAKLVNETLFDIMFNDYVNNESIINDLSFDKKPYVLLIIGVNGVGKTTTIAKLAKRYQDQGKTVMLAAADTFRAGAIEQIKVWGNRLNIEVVTGQVNSDPASVAYQACAKAKEKNVDLLIIDTAGRLQTKINLMNELSKISRVVQKIFPDGPHDTFLVVDATTGQNGVIQAKAFNEATKITGVVISKMDGTSKGGILLTIRHELNLPIRFIGLGEQMDDLKPFDIEQYLHGLLLGNE